MKKSLFFVALGALALTSCSQDEVIQVNQDAVSFSVVADNTSRGTVETTDDIDDFMVKAFNIDANGINTTVFMDNMKVYRTKDGGTWSDWTYGSTKFWPNSGEINFYSYSPANLNEKDFATVTINPTQGSNGSTSNLGAQTIQYTVPTKCSEQIDVLYALNTGMSKANKNVAVNFRHALSQIVFQAKNIKKDLKVVIKGVRVVNLKNSATFTWPAVATTVQTAIDANGDVVDNGIDTEGDSWGTWDSYATDYVSHPADITEATLAYGDDAGEVSTLTTDGNPLLLLPQQIYPATIDKENNFMKFEAGKSFFVIDCVIFNVEQTGVDASSNPIYTETQLWPATADATAEVAIPVSSPDKVVNADSSISYFWKQGRRYVYTFVFGQGAGYIGPNGENAPTDPDAPEAGGNTNTADPNEPGDPVLVPVTFTVTVDMFQTAKESIDMNTGNDAVTGTQP